MKVAETLHKGSLNAEIWENTCLEAESRNLKITDSITENRAVADILSHTKDISELSGDFLLFRTLAERGRFWYFTQVTRFLSALCERFLLLRSIEQK